MCDCVVQVLATVRAGNPISRRLFEAAYAYKKAAYARGDPVGGRLGALYDRLVFSKIKAKLGGEIKYLSSGAHQRDMSPSSAMLPSCCMCGVPARLH
jgi:long-subunit acyl-CoA synthetase (AMP-forming)